jgi:uncharacterized protein (DUF1015 family)
MCDVRPFAGLYYNPAQPDIGSKLAPPYDVLSEADKQRLLARDPRNFVRIDLPHTPPKHAGPPEAYAAARTTLDEWLSSGVFVRGTAPAIYVYHQTYAHAGRNYVRKMFFARLRLEPFGTGSVYPHEQTFGGPKEDRLLLTKATACNLSPIFGLYQDADNQVARCLEKSLPGQPLLYGDLDGVRNQMWAVTDSAVISEVQQFMASKPIYIADGHHRYGTALNYQAWLKERGELPADHPANFVLCVCCAMEDMGLLILPTHRVLPGVDVPINMLQNDPAIEVTTLPGPAGAALESLGKLGPQALALRTADGKIYALRPKDNALLDRLEPSHSPAWRRLALSFLHAYLIDRVVTPKLKGGQPPEIHYVKNIEDAVTEARETGGSVFFMQPNTMAELRDVCNAGDLMPQKSTFFYPKLASGLVINPLS